MLKKKEYDTYKLCDKKAKSLILIYMEDNLNKIFKVYTTSKDMWDTIKKEV